MIVSSEVTPTDDTGVVTNPSADAVVPSDDGKGGGAEPSRGDYDARLRSDPDFALAEVKKAQRELHQYQSKFKELEPVVNALGGSEEVMGHLRRWNAALSNAEMQEIITKFEQTGSLPPGLRKSIADSDGADDPDMDDPWTKELRERDNLLQALQSEVRSLRSERGVEKVRGFFDKFGDEYNLSDEMKQDLGDEMSKLADGWAKDPNGLNVLKSMNYETFASLALGKLGKDRLREAMLRGGDSAADQRASAATDGPGGVRTSAKGGEPAELSPVDAFKQACREFGWDPNKPLA
jgi:hypothetical protein